MADWYDYPQYFDMVFRDETAAEVLFFEQAFARFGLAKTKHLLEPGCGSGRLVAAMAARGYDVCGVDLNQRMLTYLRRRLRRRDLSADILLGDMVDLSIGQKYDAAFCTFNTFRHLLTEQDCIAHLNSIAQHLRVGGIYVLGFHIIPLDADPESTERWTVSHGGTKVSMTLKVIEFERNVRKERLRASIKATKRSGKVERIRSEFDLRLYTTSQVKKLLQKVSDVLEIAEIYDFDYDIDEPREFDDDLTDAVFVLRRI